MRRTVVVSKADAEGGGARAGERGADIEGEAGSGS